MTRTVVYRNGSTEFRIPAIEENGALFLELKCGLLVPLPARIGEMTLIADFGCEKIIAEINEAIYKFPEPDLTDFLAAHPEFNEAFRNDFAGLPPSRIIFCQKLLIEAIDRLEVETLSRSCGVLLDDAVDAEGTA